MSFLLACHKAISLHYIASKCRPSGTRCVHQRSQMQSPGSTKPTTASERLCILRRRHPCLMYLWSKHHHYHKRSAQRRPRSETHPTTRTFCTPILSSAAQRCRDWPRPRQPRQCTRFQLFALGSRFSRPQALAIKPQVSTSNPHLSPPPHRSLYISRGPRRSRRKLQGCPYRDRMPETLGETRSEDVYRVNHGYMYTSVEFQ